MTDEEIEAVKKEVEETKQRNEQLRKVARETQSRSRALEALEAITSAPRVDGEAGCTLSAHRFAEGDGGVAHIESTNAEGGSGKCPDKQQLLLAGTPAAQPEAARVGQETAPAVDVSTLPAVV